METVSHKAREKFVSTGMKLFNQGIEKGIEKGIMKTAFLMLKKGYSGKEIIDITGLSQKQLDYLKTLDEFNINTYHK